MIICLCHRVSDRAIAQHAASGQDFDSLQMDTGVATGCGRCGDCARAVFETHCKPATGACHLWDAGRWPAAVGA